MPARRATPAGRRFTPGEAEAHRRDDDPIARQRAVLAGMGVGAAELTAIHEAAQAEMIGLIAQAAATPFPADDTALSDVQDIGSPAREAF